VLPTPILDAANRGLEVAKQPQHCHGLIFLFLQYTPFF
jgi:hypothetical protein